MTFLPILERELRVRARSRGVYWSRSAMVLVGASACLPQLALSGPFGNPGTLGPGLLSGLVVSAFLLCCGACLLTADLISSERREGTLGLLLLTRVRAFDVLVGKLGSAGLASLSALVAFLPMLMLPVLAGGVTGGEAFRKGLVLPGTLFLALAAGLWASARGSEWLKTGRNALLVVAALLFGPILLDLTLVRPLAPGPTISLLSPLGALLGAGDSVYKATPAPFWISLGLVQVAGWMLVVSAGFRLRGSWQKDREEKETPAASVEPAPEMEPVQLPRRRLDASANPIAWLLERQRGTRVILWAGALFTPLRFLFYPITFRFVGARSYAVFAWPFGVVFPAIASALFAWGASRFFVGARGSGELELLLTTPLGARQLVAAQWAVLKRQLRWPVLVMLAPLALQAGAYLITISSSAIGRAYSFRFPYAISTLLGCVNVFLNVGALCWVGLWCGLKARGQARAVLWTVGLVEGLPVLAGILSSLVLNSFVRGRVPFGAAPYWILMVLSPVCNLLFYTGLICLARHHLLRRPGIGELSPFDLRQLVSASTHEALAALRRVRHWTPS